MNFYLLNGKILPETKINDDIDKSLLKAITVHKNEDADHIHKLQLTINNNTIVVRVGENDLHPMNEDEAIEEMFLQIDGKIINSITLSKDAEPTAIFMLQNISSDEIANHKITVYAYCNKTGMWKVNYN